MLAGVLFCLATCAAASTGPQQQEGVLTPWESKAVLNHAQERLKLVNEALGAIDTEQWKGDYAPLVVSTRQRTAAVVEALSRMADRPLSLSVGVEAFLSMQHLEGNIDTLAKASEKFQPAIVTALEQASNSLQQVKEQFQGYLLDLSRYMEKNLSIASKDLESCREQMWKRPPAAPAAQPKKRTR